MKIVVGLGNPGPRYETTRHNAGFLAIDRLVEKFRADGPKNDYRAEIFETSFDSERVFFVKPQTYMNKSGESIGPMARFFKCPPENVIVIHDDVDLKPVTMRIKTGGGAGGHNGIRSMDQHLSPGYHRIRIGVGRSLKIPTEDFVLMPFTDHELNELDALLDQVAQATELLLHGKTTEAMNQFNRKERKEDQ